MDKSDAERKKYGPLHVAGILPIIEAGILLSGGQISDESNPAKSRPFSSSNKSRH